MLNRTFDRTEIQSIQRARVSAEPLLHLKQHADQPVVRIAAELGYGALDLILRLSADKSLNQPALAAIAKRHTQIFCQTHLSLFFLWEEGGRGGSSAASAFLLLVCACVLQAGLPVLLYRSSTACGMFGSKAAWHSIASIMYCLTEY